MLDIEPLGFVVIALASYRLTRLIVTDQFPPVHWFRVHVVEKRLKENSTLRELLSCPYCASFWCSALVLAGWLVVPLSHYLIWPLAIAGVVAIIWNTTEE